MEINEYIDNIGNKYNYSTELIDALKKCIPVMICDKSEEDVALLMSTLERVQIYTFDDQPKKEEINYILENKLDGRNKHVKWITLNRGEYDNTTSPSAYVNEPVFDENMNIIDRVGFIYLKNLRENSETANFYGTKINMSYLIHELGHAWAAQKDEFLQDPNGNYTMSVGTSKTKGKVDRKTHTVEETNVTGLYVEEALNSIEEEDSLYRIYGVNNFKDIPNYLESEYQGPMTVMMRYFIEKLGFDYIKNIRYQKDYSKIEILEKVFKETDFFKIVHNPDYFKRKKEVIDSAQNTSMSENSKERVKKFFNKYNKLYMSLHVENGFLEHIDKVMEQLYNFSSIKYSYNIFNEDMNQAYQQTLLSILKEGYIPINEMYDIIEINKKKENKINEIIKEAIDNKIRTGEIEVVDKQMQSNINKKVDNVKFDEPNLRT